MVIPLNKSSSLSLPFQYDVRLIIRNLHFFSETKTRLKHSHNQQNIHVLMQQMIYTDIMHQFVNFLYHNVACPFYFVRKSIPIRKPNIFFIYSIVFLSYKIS